MDLIAAVQASFDRALLERLPIEERFGVDVFLGDVTWETSYSLPGEGQPPRVRVDVTVEWPTWSQSAYRSWSMGEQPAELPEAIVEVAMRIQRLAEPPDPERVLQVLPSQSPPIGSEPLVRTTTSIGEVRTEPEPEGAPKEQAVRYEVEGSYEGTIHFEEAQLEDPERLVELADALTRWISSLLVQLADLPLTFHPPDPADAA